MARHTIKVPDMGATAKGIVVVEWHVEPGQHVDADTALTTVEIEKVDTQIPSPMAGVLIEILASPGAELNVGDALCVIES